MKRFAGEIGILNVGAGDVKLSFDKNNPAERARAAKIMTEMFKRGYAILIQVGEQKRNGRMEPIYQRAHGFDPETCEYIIAGGPDETIDIGDLVRSESVEPPAKRGPGRPRKSEVRVEASRTRAVAVGRSAGG